MATAIAIDAASTERLVRTRRDRITCCLWMSGISTSSSLKVKESFAAGVVVLVVLVVDIVIARGTAGVMVLVVLVVEIMMEGGTVSNGLKPTAVLVVVVVAMVAVTVLAGVVTVVVDVVVVSTVVVIELRAVLVADVAVMFVSAWCKCVLAVVLIESLP